NNQRCEQFWFPGCRTIQTNLNLFDSVEECIEKTSSGTFVPFFTTRRPTVPVSVDIPPPPIPLVAPFLATTTAPPRAVVPIIDIATSRVAPTVQSRRFRPWIEEISGEVVDSHVRIVDPQSSLKTSQPYWVTSPSGARTILGLISRSIAQLTGGSGEPGGDGSFFHQIPQFLRFLQGG
uniref:BPTI/Kunitz inhibitor domain-containing protein n=1 Tax=Elaeophora elaphi TaxID=1147741 RepID=A0A0R3RZZ3_9BILA